jgi:hypothetical protein
VTFRELVAQAGGPGVPVADVGGAVTVTAVVAPAAGALEALAGPAGVVDELDEDAQPASAAMQQIRTAAAQPAALPAPELTTVPFAWVGASCAALQL